jgi:hypothetical protein
MGVPAYVLVQYTDTTFQGFFVGTDVSKPT